MNWKKYKALPLAQKRDETHYIIGLDLGNDSSGMAFFNLATNTPEPIDISGGYGKPSIPTVMQYIAETKEWVFGEYAVLNRGAGTEITLNNLIERLGNFDYIDVDRRSLSVAGVLALFIKELLGNVRSINPKAEIVGIVAGVPAYFSQQAYDELTRAFNLAGFEKELIALVPDRECVLAHHYQTHAINSAEHTLLLDFGARELRGGLYHVKPKGADIIAASISSLFNHEVGVSSVNATVSAFFEDFVRREVSKNKPISPTQARQLHEQCEAFSYQHRDMLFQKNIRTKPIKAYFNFTYPPFQQVITHEQVTALMRPFTHRFATLLSDVFAKSIADTALTPKDISTVLCVGGGFEMLWARETITKMFDGVHFYKNPKMVTCQGAAVVAAHALGIPEAGKNMAITDTHQLTYDIGLAGGTNFLPLVERNAFWWQNHAPKLMLVNQEVTGELCLNICKRTPAGEIIKLADMHLDALPTRPKGTTRLEVGLNFASNTSATITVCDKGFGELFPAAEWERVVDIAV